MECTRRDALKSLLISGIVLLPQVAGGELHGGDRVRGSLRRSRSFPTYKQPDGISCGPTCCRMVLRYYGIRAGIEPLKTAAGTRLLTTSTTRVGLTVPSGIRAALNRYGVSSTVGVMRRGGLTSVKSLIDQDRPPILLVRSGTKTWHYIVVVGYRKAGAEFEFVDPSGIRDWLSAKKLDLGWTFSGDYSGNRIQGRRCRMCGGGGKIAKGWTKCVTCRGSGKIGTLFGKKKCVLCSGRGKWSSRGTRCITCGGDGRETDAYRKAVESAGVSGRTLIVPKRAPGGGRTSGASSASGASSGNSDTSRRVSVRVANTSRNKVSYALRRGTGPWQRYSLLPGKVYKHSTSERQSRITIRFDSSFRSGFQKSEYTLSTGRTYEFRQRKGEISLRMRRR